MISPPQRPKPNTNAPTTEPIIEELAERQISDYHALRERFTNCNLNFGKDPERAEGDVKTVTDIC